MAIVVAGLSGYDKAEVERIRLPFAGWLTAGAALLPRRSRRTWLAAQAAVAPPAVRPRHPARAVHHHLGVLSAVPMVAAA